MKKSPVPEISVILPVYNSTKYLEECIDSILNQTFDNFELIIIDDLSTDNSREIITRKKRENNRIVFIKNKKNLGTAGARNKGLEKANGRYIAMMDSDDISLPNRLEKQFSFLEENKDYFLIGSSGIRIDENGNYLERIKFKEDIYINSFKKSTPILQSSIMFRNINIRYREKFLLSEDTDLYLRALTMGLKLGNIEETLVKVRMRTTSTCMTNWPRGQLFQDLARKFYDQRIESGKDEYDSFDEKEIMSIPIGDSMKNYLKSLIGLSLKNGNIEEAKKYFEQYSKKIDFKNKIMYKIVFAFPILYSMRLKIKFFFRNIFDKN
ncbi:MAG: glycosyltransferase family 2 protein [Methanofastidiosum sp.]